MFDDFEDFCGKFVDSYIGKISDIFGRFFDNLLNLSMSILQENAVFFRSIYFLNQYSISGNLGNFLYIFCMKNTVSIDKYNILIARYSP